MDEQLSSPDLLSDLPLCIIHIILSFVPIRDVVRTSLLSTQWRYIWTSLPYLAFDGKCVNPPMEHWMMIHFISQVLLRHEGPIHKFKLCMPPLLNFQRIDQWLLFLSKNDVRILVLEFENGFFGFMIYPSLYSCQNLTHLKIHVNDIPPPPPYFKGFLFLRSLDIRTREVDSSTMESIVAHSPMLEQFTLDFSDYKGSEMTIRAPNLKYFNFVSVRNRLSLCTPLLEELIGDFTFIRHFSILVESIDGSLFFHHLKTIKLFGVPFHVKEVATDVIRLIIGSPHLQKLEIFCSCWPVCEKSETSFWDTESIPDFTYDSLKVIKMGGFYVEIEEIELIKFLLARSPVLERMIYLLDPSRSDQVLLNLNAEWLSCPRASENVEVVIEKNLVYQADNIEYFFDVPVLDAAV